MDRGVTRGWDRGFGSGLGPRRGLWLVWEPFNALSKAARGVVDCLAWSAALEADTEGEAGAWGEACGGR